MTTKKKPLPIQLTTQRELWARAAGRCEFRGCNKLVSLHEPTQKRSNLSMISHIVARKPDGPRGDPIRSPLLARDIGNLMLTCRPCGNIIDDKTRVSEYPEELLLEFKAEHERRVRMLTEVKEDSQTQVLIFQAAIDDSQVEISETEAFNAILPLYSIEEHPTRIDLGDFTISPTLSGYFNVISAHLAQKIKAFKEGRAHNPKARDKQISIFALAPVPLLIHLGWCLGDIPCVNLYQKHRGKHTNAWRWQAEEETLDQYYSIQHPEAQREKSQPIVLLLSISDQINHNSIDRDLLSQGYLIEVRANKPGRDFLRSRTRLELFGYELRQLMDELRKLTTVDDVVHVIAAVPAPVAIEFGRNIRKHDPAFQLYEYDKASRTHRSALTINQGGASS